MAYSKDLSKLLPKDYYPHITLQAETSIHAQIYVYHFSYAHFPDPVDCQYIESESSDAALLTVAYVMAAVCVLCLLPISVLLIQASLRRRNRNNNNRSEVHEASPKTKLTDSLHDEKYDGSSRKQ